MASIYLQPHFPNTYNEEENYLFLKLDVVVRKATLDDLNAVIAINREALPENYHYDFFLRILQNYNDLFYVAEYNDEIIGYIMCRVEWGLPHIGFGLVSKGHIVSLAVRTPYRRRGVASRLLEAVHNKMKQMGIKEAFLEVRVNNIPAIKLYEKFGYRVVRRIPGYYADGMDGYLMSLSLS
ncbi:ribosomal-protein-alanine N-acetyltransferase [archaeon]|nr:MAG: ribosomal-protein-alanine N-acetyltransferase [archaeon]